MIKEHLYYNLITYWLIDYKIIFATSFEKIVFLIVTTQQSFANSSDKLIQDYIRKVKFYLSLNTLYIGLRNLDFFFISFAFKERWSIPKKNKENRELLRLSLIEWDRLYCNSNLALLLFWLLSCLAFNLTSK